MCTCIHICTYVCTYSYIEYIYSYIGMHMRICEHVWTRTCKHTGVFLSIHIINVFIYIYVDWLSVSIERRDQPHSLRWGHVTNAWERKWTHTIPQSSLPAPPPQWLVHTPRWAQHGTQIIWSVPYCIQPCAVHPAPSNAYYRVSSGAHSACTFQ